MIIVEAGRCVLRGSLYCLFASEVLYTAEILITSWLRPTGPSPWYGDRGGEGIEAASQIALGLAARMFKMTFVAYIIFILDSTVLVLTLATQSGT